MRARIDADDMGIVGELALPDLARRVACDVEHGDHAVFSCNIQPPQGEVGRDYIRGSTQIQNAALLMVGEGERRQSIVTFACSVRELALRTEL